MKTKKKIKKVNKNELKKVKGGWSVTVYEGMDDRIVPRVVYDSRLKDHKGKP
jgi:bacteriocin-like protein